MKQRVVLHHPVRLVRVMASVVEHITCSTFSSLPEGVALPTSAFIDNVVHACCDAGQSTLFDACHSLSHHLLVFIGADVRENCDAIHSFMPSRSHQVAFDLVQR